MMMGYHKPPPPATIDYAFDVIESILARGRTSRFFKTLIDEKRIAEGIHAINGLPGSRYPNQFVVFATPRHPYTLIDLELAIDMVIERLKTEPVSDAELDKVKNQLRADFIRGSIPMRDLRECCPIMKRFLETSVILPVIPKPLTGSVQKTFFMLHGLI
jgi:predicted Zn-dependent peptidase